jgi:hypothetical protein
MSEYDISKILHQIKEDNGGCGGRSGCTGVATDESHSCPYQNDVNNDPDYQCNCCEDCEHECAMDI